MTLVMPTIPHTNNPNATPGRTIVQTRYANIKLSVVASTHTRIFNLSLFLESLGIFSKALTHQKKIMRNT